MCGKIPTELPKINRGRKSGRQRAAFYYGETTAWADCIPGHSLLYSFLHHFRQTITFENEARMRLENNVLCNARGESLQEEATRALMLLNSDIMHSTAEYGGWFSSKMRSSLAVGSVRGRITFSPQTNRSRVRLKAYRDHLFEEVSVRLFGPLLVRTRVRLLHSHLPKRTAPKLKTNSSAIQPN